MAYDVLGGDDSMEGEFDIVGAARRGLPMRAARMPTGQPARAYQWVLGFPSTGSVAAAGTVTITARPQRPFRVERLVIPAAAGVWVVSQFVVGADSQLVNLGGEVDASTFSPTAVGITLSGSSATSAMDISLTLINISAAAATLRGIALIGTALEAR